MQKLTKEELSILDRVAIAAYPKCIELADEQSKPSELAYGAAVQFIQVRRKVIEANEKK